MQTQKLDSPVIAESVGSDAAFNEDSIVEPVSVKTAADLDQSFIDELETSLVEEIDRDQLKA